MINIRKNIIDVCNISNTTQVCLTRKSSANGSPVYMYIYKWYQWLTSLYVEFTKGQ
jgi:hypothetical protein